MTMQNSFNLSKHRIEALTDGIYAVAMTLLVIELKLVNIDAIKTNAQLVDAVIQLTPKFIAWIISFFVLALFWLGNHRLFQYVRHVDSKLLFLCILGLGAVSLMPFASSLSGEFVRSIFAQCIYSTTMILVALSAMLLTRYIYMHPELGEHGMPEGTYRSAQFRLWGLICISLVAIVIALYLSGMGNTAFLLMLIISPISRRIENNYNIHSQTDIESA